MKKSYLSSPIESAPSGYKWVQVQVWVPTLSSLSLSKEMISNDYKQSEPDYVVSGKSFYTTTDGTIKTIEDIFFATDKFDTKEEEIAVSEEIEGLPDIASIGTLHSFHQLMARDEDFKKTVVDFIFESDISKQYVKINDVLYKWAGLSFTENYSNQKLEFLEKYFGTSITVDTTKIDTIFNSIKKNIFNQLMLKSNYAWIGNFINSITNTDGTETVDFTPLKSVFDFLFMVENKEKVMDIYSKIGLIVKSSTIYNSSNFKEIENILASEHGELKQKIEEYNLISTANSGSNFNDIINSGGGNDYIYGGDGNDTIDAGDGADIITGGTGNDFLNGSGDNDIYIFNKGDGQDTIYDHLDYNAGQDTLKFGEGISINDVMVKQSGTDLIVAIKDGDKDFADLTDKITIKEWYDLNMRIETFEFADGTKFDIVEIVKLFGTNEKDVINWGETALNISSLTGDDIVNSGSFSDVINLGAGNDTVNSGAGDDIITAEDGDDFVNADVGNDTINGGKGNDILQGRSGNDTYIFNKGDGQDEIYDAYLLKGDANQNRNSANYSRSYDAGSDTLKFGEGITKNDVMIKQSGTNIIVAIKDGDKDFADLTDKITIKEWKDLNMRVETFEFADGTKLDMNNLILTSTANDTITGNEKNNIIFSNEGNDTIKGGSGNDFLYGGSGDDTYIFNSGDGIDTIIDESGNHKITTNINPLDLIFRKNQEDLEIMVSGTADKIMVKNYKTAGNVEKIEVLNNQYISSSKIDELIQAMSVFGSQHEGISWETALKDKKDDVSLLVSGYYQTNI